MPRHTRTEVVVPEAEPTVAATDHVRAPAEAVPEQAAAPARLIASPEAPSGKLGEIHTKIAGSAGATIDDLVASTDWQPHTKLAPAER